jgi:predicted HAD superfamily Cof-like phosphohydrolase
MELTGDVDAQAWPRAGPDPGPRAAPLPADRGHLGRALDPMAKPGCAQGGDMNQEQQMVHQFHERFGLVSNSRPSVPGGNVHRLRTLLIEEELAEFRNAGEAHDVVGVADALADLLYVVYGAAEEYGIDLEPVFAEIHRSNMTKDARRGCRADGKVRKGEAYVPPDVRGVVESQFEAARLVVAVG